ncbi:MAG: hypothetical protein RLY58_2194 [Pseudomonadota bacterium]|jgi:hypothetical protein
MTIVERLYQSLHIAQISFSVMYALASFFFLLTRPDDSLLDAGALGLCLTLWIIWLLLSKTCVMWSFTRAGADEAALIKTQRQLWSMVCLLGLSCVIGSWICSCSIYR